MPITEQELDESIRKANEFSIRYTETVVKMRTRILNQRKELRRLNTLVHYEQLRNACIQKDLRDQSSCMYTERRAMRDQIVVEKRYSYWKGMAVAIFLSNLIWVFKWAGL